MFHFIGHSVIPEFKWHRILTLGCCFNSIIESRNIFIFWLKQRNTNLGYVHAVEHRNHPTSHQSYLRCRCCPLGFVLYLSHKTNFFKAPESVERYPERTQVRNSRGGNCISGELTFGQWCCFLAGESHLVEMHPLRGYSVIFCVPVWSFAGHGTWLSLTLHLCEERWCQTGQFREVTVGDELKSYLKGNLAISGDIFGCHN